MCSSETEALDKLYNGRFDFLPADVQIFEYMIKELYPGEEDKFEFLLPPIGVNNYMLIVSETYPNGEEIIEIFNEGLRKIKENGVYDRIMKEHQIVIPEG